jgi:hypothetical protein
MGLLVVTLVGLNQVSMPDATAEQFLAPSAGPGVETVPAIVATVGPKTGSAAKALAGPITRRSASVVGRLESLARTDPWALARLGRERYQREIRDYTCVFLKQERIGGKLRELEEIEVRFREDPKTVYMLWKRNANQAKRVLFKDAPEFVNKEGEKLARVEPAGALIRLVVSDVLMPIHGKRAHQSSRRSIDDFGVRSTLDLLDHYNQLGADRGVLDLRYDGEGEVDGRATYKIVRFLPYDGPNGIWPDAKMVMHIDQEWLLPTAVYSYADREGTKLLGSYVHTKVKLNPGLDAQAFEF